MQGRHWLILFFGFIGILFITGGSAAVTDFDDTIIHDLIPAIVDAISDISFGGG